MEGGEVDFDPPEGNDPVIEDMPNLYDEMQEEINTRKEELEASKNDDKTVSHPPWIYRVHELEDEVTLLLQYVSRAKDVFDWYNRERTTPTDDPNTAEEREAAQREYEEAQQTYETEEDEFIELIKKYRESLKAQISFLEREHEMHASLIRARKENKELEIENVYKNKQIRQLKLGLEDLERFIRQLKEVIEDPSRTEAEKEAAKEKLEGIQKRIAVLESRKDRLETEVSVIRKERIMIRLMKYGIPAALASMLAAVISLVVALGISIKQNGIALERQGKEMASKNPGLLFSVVALIEKTAGRILEFVGNNMWILVVVVGLLILLKI